MHRRRAILKRVAFWGVASTLLLVLYVASAPFAFDWCAKRLPASIPTLQFVYAPLAVYSRHADWPGSNTYVQYQLWCHKMLQEYANGPERANVVLDSSTQIQFTGTPLRKVADYLSEVHDFPIEFVGQVNSDTEITIDSTASLRKSLQEMLEPLGLVAAPDDGRIMIGTPESIDWIVTRRRANNPLIAWGPWIALAIGLLFAGALSLLLRSMNVKRRAGTTPAE